MVQFRRPSGLLLALTLVSCAGSAPKGDQVSHRLVVDTVASADEGVFFRPADMVVLPSGQLAVLEYTPSSIIVIDPSSGALVRRIGEPGKGPGQLLTPLGLQLAGDTLLTLNVGNGRIERFLGDGKGLGSSLAPDGIGMGRVAMNPDGGILAPTAGAEGTLLRVLTPSGAVAHTIGEPLAAFNREYDLGAFRQLAAQSKVPPYYANDVLAAMTTDSLFWLAFASVPELAVYERTGQRKAVVRLADSAAAPILEEYRRQNQEASQPPRFHPLLYFADVRVAGGMAWALLRNPPDADARVLVADSSGRVVADLVFAGAKDVWRIAPDLSRGRIYLSSASASEIYRAELPKALSR